MDYRSKKPTVCGRSKIWSYSKKFSTYNKLKSKEKLLNSIVIFIRLDVSLVKNLKRSKTRMMCSKPMNNTKKLSRKIQK